jgi:hypothetical protein
LQSATTHVASHTEPSWTTWSHSPCPRSAFISAYSSAPVPKSIEIAKVALGYIPMVFEIASYLLAHELRGRIAYPKEGVISRSGAVLIITLGGGLDKITKGFQFNVGNTILGIDGAGVFVSEAVILVAQFRCILAHPGV